MKNDQRILEIIKNKIVEKYSEDIALLVVYGTKKEMKDERLGLQCYFVPKNEKAKNLTLQFIVEGVSYDLFPMSWDRLIANAAMDSPQGYLLLDTEIIYYSDEKVLNRFNQMKESLEVVLSGEYEEVLLNKAYEYFNESYIYIYNMKEYKNSLSSVRLEAGKLLNKIANALGFANSVYYKSGNGSVLRDSLKLSEIPVDYESLVNDILFAKTSGMVIDKSVQLVKNTRKLLLGLKKNHKQEELFSTLFVGYYEELKKSLNKCKIAVERQDYYELYELCSYMQEEVAQFIAKSEEGIWYNDRNVFVEYSNQFEEIFELDLLETVSSKDDKQIIFVLEKFEQRLVSLIELNDIEILEFSCVEEFDSCFSEK